MTRGLSLGLHLGRGGAGRFDPRSLPNLLAWYDAPALALANDAAVASWPDASGHGRDLTQATGTIRPTYRIAVQNGLAAVRFDGGDWLNRTTVDLSAYTALTAFVVGKFDDFAVNRAVLSFGSVGSTAGSFELRALATSGVFDTVGYITGSTVWSASALDTTWHVLTGRVDFSLATGEALGWVDGSSTGSQTANPNNTGAFSSSANLTIGDRQNGAAKFKGDVGEVLLYGASLAAADHRAIESYLRTKWGTP